MPNEVPVLTLSGLPTPYALTVEVQGPDARLSLSADFVGRDVDEEIALSALQDMVAGGPRRDQDLLGLTMETDGGDTILWTVSVGSGNERFLTRREDLERALK